MRMGLRVMVAGVLTAQAWTALAAGPGQMAFPSLSKAREVLQDARVDLQKAEEVYATQGTLDGHGRRASEALEASHDESDGFRLAIRLDLNRSACRLHADRDLPKPRPTALPADVRCPLLGDARLKIERAVQLTQDAGEYHAPIGSLGGHALKAIAAAQRALGEVNQAESWLDAHRSSPTVAAKPTVAGDKTAPSRSAAEAAAPSSPETENIARPDPPWAIALPTVDKIRASIEPGKDEHDTDRREHAAFGIWTDFVEVLGDYSTNEPTRAKKVFPPAAYTRWTEYRSIWTDYRGGPSTDLSEYEHSRDFRLMTLSKLLSNEDQKPYWAVRDKSPIFGTTPSSVKAKEDRLAAKADEQRRADQDAQRAQEKQQGRTAEDSVVAKAQALCDRDSHLAVFGVCLGMPISAIPKCVFSEFGIAKPGPGKKMCKSDGADGEYLVTIDASNVPTWMSGWFADLSVQTDDGTIASISLSTKGDDEFIAAVNHKYGKPSRTSEVSYLWPSGVKWKALQLEWSKLAKVHVEYVPGQEQYRVEARAGTFTVESTAHFKKRGAESEAERAGRLKL